MCDEAAEALQAAKDGGASAEEIEAAEKALAAAQEGYKEALGFATAPRNPLPFWRYWRPLLAFRVVLCLGHLDYGQWKLEAGETADLMYKV